MNKQTKGQLIFTTHDSNLLDQKIIRRDEVWFAEKNKEGKTKLYSLDVKDGSVLWSKNHKTPFNSQIKIFKKHFFTIDSNNTFICYSMTFH